MLKASLRSTPRQTLVALAMALAGVCAHAQNVSFAQAYDAALGYDARYRSAEQDRNSAQQELPLARAALLPQLSANASDSRVLGTRRVANQFNQDTRLRADYEAPSYSLNLRMPLLNYDAISRYRQAKVQVEMADSQYQAQGSDLVDRLSSAYLQMLMAQESKRLIETQVKALTVQHQQAKARLKSGEGTRQDEALTRASLDVARARVLEAEDQVQLSARQLQRITGLPTTPLRVLPQVFKPTPLFSSNLGDWLSLAMQNSPTLRARELRVQVAKMGVERTKAGHMPRLDLVASLAHSENESLSSLNQTSTLRTMGLQLSVPLYSGGAVVASTKQATADQLKAEEEVRNEKENIAVEVQRNLQTVSTGDKRLAAYEQAVDSAELALKASNRALETGVGTLSDVADTQAKLFLAKRDLTQAQLDYLTARVRLQLQAGVPIVDISNDLDRALMANNDIQRVNKP